MNIVPDQPCELPNRMSPATGHTRSSELSLHKSAGALAVGLEFLAATHQDTHWVDFSKTKAEVWATAQVLVRLAELPASHLSLSLRQQVKKSLDWLLDVSTPGGGWSCRPGDEPDALTTSWAILALRRYGRRVPASALEFLQRCRRPDGGFAAYPQGSPEPAGDQNATEITVTAVRALGTLHPVTEEFLSQRMQSFPAASASQPSSFYVCSEIMDWENGMAPVALLTKVSQLCARFAEGKAYEQALMLRCLLRLRSQRAWPVAARLREMQLPDGSWPASCSLLPVAQPVPATGPAAVDDQRIMTTATAISALAMGELQPGLYFGSDLPRPRRFGEL